MSFLRTYGPSILTNLKRLRVSDFRLNEENLPVFSETPNSFGQLEELGLFRTAANMKSDLELNLPMLTSLEIDHFRGVEKFTLNTFRRSDFERAHVWSILQRECFVYNRKLLKHSHRNSF